MNLLVTATLLALFAGLLLGPVSTWLSRSRWVFRSPRSAVLLWQCLGLSAAVSGIGAGMALAVNRYQSGFFAGTKDLFAGIAEGHPLQGLGLYDALGLTLAAGLAIVLLVVFGVVTIRTVQRRARHRRILDLVSLQYPEFPGTEFLADKRPVAYCLPGLRPRIVLSDGTLALLDSEEVWAVIHHERGHAREHHGLVMLPMEGLEKLFWWIPYARHGPSAISMLLEMAADDFSARRSGRPALARALAEMAATSWAPRCGLAAAKSGVSARIGRLLDTQTSKPAATLAVGLAAGVVLLPLCILAVP